MYTPRFYYVQGWLNYLTRVRVSGLKCSKNCCRLLNAPWIFVKADCKNEKTLSVFVLWTIEGEETNSCIAPQQQLFTLNSLLLHLITPMSWRKLHYTSSSVHLKTCFAEVCGVFTFLVNKSEHVNSIYKTLLLSLLSLSKLTQLLVLYFKQ